MLFRLAVWIAASIGVRPARLGATVSGLIMAASWLVTLSDHSPEPSPQPSPQPPLPVIGAGSSAVLLLPATAGCLGAAWYSTPLPASSQRIHPVNGGWLALISSASPKPIGEYQERVGFDNDRDHTSRRSKVISDRYPPASQYRARAPQLDAIRALPPPITHARATSCDRLTG